MIQIIGSDRVAISFRQFDIDIDYIMQTGKIFDIKKYAIHDGPGIRTTIFFKGCPLSCWWCHNPEGIAPITQRLYRQERCIGCGLCVTGCPEDVAKLQRKPEAEIIDPPVDFVTWEQERQKNRGLNE